MKQKSTFFVLLSKQWTKSIPRVTSLEEWICAINSIVDLQCLQFAYFNITIAMLNYTCRWPDPEMLLIMNGQYHIDICLQREERSKINSKAERWGQLGNSDPAVSLELSLSLVAFGPNAIYRLRSLLQNYLSRCWNQVLVLPCSEIEGDS